MDYFRFNNMSKSQRICIRVPQREAEDQTAADSTAADWLMVSPAEQAMINTESFHSQRSELIFSYCPPVQMKFIH